MNFITTALNKLFKSSNQQELNKIKPLVQKINNLEKDFLNFTQERFVEKTNQLIKNISEGRDLDDALPEAFALVREAAKQTLNERHFNEKGSFVKLSYPTLKEEYSVVGPAIELSENPGKIKHRSPELGEHNQQILMELGYTQEEINQLKKDRII